MSKTHSFSSSSDYCTTTLLTGSIFAAFVCLIFLAYIIKVLIYRNKFLKSDKSVQRNPSVSRYYEFAWERTMLIFTGALFQQFFPWLQLCRPDLFIVGVFGAIGLIITYSTILVRVFRAFVFTVPTRDPRTVKKRVRWFFMTENGYLHLAFVGFVLQGCFLISLTTTYHSENFILLFCTLVAVSLLFLCELFVFLTLVRYIFFVIISHSLLKRQYDSFHTCEIRLELEACFFVPMSKNCLPTTRAQVGVIIGFNQPRFNVSGMLVTIPNANFLYYIDEVQDHDSNNAFAFHGPALLP